MARQHGSQPASDGSGRLAAVSQSRSCAWRVWIVVCVATVCHSLAHSPVLVSAGVGSSHGAASASKHAEKQPTWLTVGPIFTELREMSAKDLMAAGLQATSIANHLSSLNASIVEDIRQALGIVALRLDSALSVDRSNLERSSPPATAAIEARTQQTIRERAILSRMQATLRELEGLPQTCSHHFFSRLQDDFLLIRPLSIVTGSPLIPGHTMSFSFDHRSLIDADVSLPNADDLRIYYQRSLDEEPVEVHRIIEGIGTAKATLHFPIVEHLSADTTYARQYALAFGNPLAHSPLCDPRRVFLLYEDFTTGDKFTRDWTVQRGTWTVQHGYLNGVTILSDKDAAGGMELEVGAYYNSGFDWKNVEVQMDIQVDSSSPNPSPILGPFLRTDRPALQKTTGLFAEYTGTDGSTDMGYCSVQRDVVEETRKLIMPSPFRHNVWHRIRHVIVDNQVSEWFDGQPIEPQASILDSLARSGTLGIGCRVTGSQSVCSTMFDNMRVRSVAAREPVLTLPLAPCPQEREIKGVLGQFASVAADSCRQIYELSFQDGLLASANGIFFIRTPSGPVETYCDMTNGGWTLVAQIGGSVGDISRSLLKSNLNTEQLRSPTIAAGNVVSSLNAVQLAVNHASEILFSNSNQNSIGTRWVRWPLPVGRDEATLWNRAVGAAVVRDSALAAVRVVNWQGLRQTCLQNRFGVSWPHGAYPATVRMASGAPLAQDFCMAVGVLPLPARGVDRDGFADPLTGYDAPASESDWFNSNTGQQQTTMSIWLK